MVYYSLMMSNCLEFRIYLQGSDIFLQFVKKNAHIFRCGHLSSIHYNSFSGNKKEKQQEIPRNIFTFCAFRMSVFSIPLSGKLYNGDLFFPYGRKYLFALYSGSLIQFSTAEFEFSILTSTS